MTGAGPDVARLAGAVAKLLDRPVMRQRPPAWRAWGPGGRLLLFESEHEDVARFLVVLLAAQLGARPVLLESPDGVDCCYRDGYWHPIPDEGDQSGADGARGLARGRLRLIVTDLGRPGG